LKNIFGSWKGLSASPLSTWTQVFEPALLKDPQTPLAVAHRQQDGQAGSFAVIRIP
jgi:hypothetical protein